MTDIGNKDVSDPLKHLLTLDFGHTSLENVSQDVCHLPESWTKRLRKVRFADPQTQVATNSSSPTSHPLKELKGILKNKTFQENNLALFNLTTVHPLHEDYSDDFSSLEECESEGNSEQEVDEVVNMYQVSKADHGMLPTECYEEASNSGSIENSVRINDENNTFAEEIENNQSPSKSFSESSVSFQEIQVVEKSNVISPSKIQMSKIRKQSIYSLQQKQPRLIINCTQQADKNKHHLVKTWNSGTKPKIHFCIISALNAEVQPHMPKSKSKQKFTKSPQIWTEMKQENIFQQKEYRNNFMKTELCMNWLPLQTMKLRRFLQQNAEYSLCAKELRLFAFNSWCKVKKEAVLMAHEEKSSENTSVKDNNNKTSCETSSEAFIRWKRKKEAYLRGKKGKNTVNYSTKEVRSSQSETPKLQKSGEKDMVYCSWKSKKRKRTKRTAGKSATEDQDR